MVAPDVVPLHQQSIRAPCAAQRRMSLTIGPPSGCIEGWTTDSGEVADDSAIASFRVTDPEVRAERQRHRQVSGRRCGPS